MNFVNFETAKKLKEKGFNQPCLAHYTNGTFEYNIEYCDAAILQDLYQNWGNNAGCFVDAPTISQVLKWLREDKNIFIELEYINQNTCGCIIIEQKTGGLIAKWDFDKFQYAEKNPLVGNTYEEASLAGIKYCLDNLI